MIAIVVWLLPEPNSPTMATVSLAATSRSMPLTAATVPSLVSKSTRRSRTVRTGSGMLGLRLVAGQRWLRTSKYIEKDEIYA